MIKVPDGKENGKNDYFIIGFEKSKEGKQDYFLVDSLHIRAGKKLPGQLKDYILEHYEDGGFYENEVVWKHLFGIEKDHRIRIGGCLV